MRRGGNDRGDRRTPDGEARARDLPRPDRRALAWLCVGDEPRRESLGGWRKPALADVHELLAGHLLDLDEVGGHPLEQIEVGAKRVERRLVRLVEDRGDGTGRGGLGRTAERAVLATDEVPERAPAGDPARGLRIGAQAPPGDHGVGELVRLLEVVRGATCVVDEQQCLGGPTAHQGHELPAELAFGRQELVTLGCQRVAEGVAVAEHADPFDRARVARGSGRRSRGLPRARR